jgi:predicted phage terminase large subunit-like protein
LPTTSKKATIQLYNDWYRRARTKQLKPRGDWNIWLILAGRGWGKTLTGAIDVVLYAISHENVRVAVVAPTSGDLRRVCFEGISGIISQMPLECYKDGYSSYNKSTSEIELYNGSKIMGFSASEPDRFRGSQYHRAWCDELAAWKYPDSWNQLQFGMRLGNRPQTVVTTTPRPTNLIKQLYDRQDVYKTQGSTFENKDNLAESALELFKKQYEGTRLGKQELYAEILEDIEGALWSLNMIEQTRVNEIPEMKRVVVAVDPAVTNNKNSDETGIVVCGLGIDNRYYIIDDVSGKMSADAWAKTAVNVYYKYKASRIIAEVNNGGDLVERLLRTVDKNIPYKSVSASRGKVIRAEPISALYEQQRVSHCGVFSKLEDQMCSFTGDKSTSPDRLDALVWGLTELSKSSMTALWRVS